MGMKKEKEKEKDPEPGGVDARLEAFTRSLQYVGTHSVLEPTCLVAEDLQRGSPCASGTSANSENENSPEGGRGGKATKRGGEEDHGQKKQVHNSTDLARNLLLMWQYPGHAVYFLRWKRYTLLKGYARREAQENVGPLSVFAKDPRRRTPSELKQPAAYMQLLRFFQGSSPEALQQVARCVHLREFDPEEYILTKGDPGDSFYVIVAGIAQVLLEMGGARTFDSNKTITKRAGDSFGEMALLQEGGRRSASVVAKKIVLCLQLTKRDFDIHIKHALEQGVRKKMDALCAVTLLRSCSLARLREMALLLTEVNLEVSHKVIHQGQDASDMYFILEGYVDVYRSVTSTMEATKLHSLGPGDCFGEGVLLGKATHGVSVTARTKVKALKLLRRDFTALFLLAASRELGTRATRRGTSESAICRLVSKERAWAMYKKVLVEEVISNRIDHRFATEQANPSARSQRRGADDTRWPVPVNFEGWLNTDSVCSLQAHFTAKDRWDFLHAGCVLVARLTDASASPALIQPLAKEKPPPVTTPGPSPHHQVAPQGGSRWSIDGPTTVTSNSITKRTVTFSSSGTSSWGGPRSPGTHEKEFADVALLDLVFQEWELYLASHDNFLTLRLRHDTLAVLSLSKEDIGDYSHDAAGSALELSLGLRAKMHDTLDSHNAKEAHGRGPRLLLHCALSIGPTFVKIGSMERTGAKLMERIQGPNLEKACRLCDICLRSVPDHIVGGSLAVASLLAMYNFELLPYTDDNPTDRHNTSPKKSNPPRHPTSEAATPSSKSSTKVPTNTPSSPTPKNGIPSSPQTPTQEDPATRIWMPAPTTILDLHDPPFPLPSFSFIYNSQPQKTTTAARTPTKTPKLRASPTLRRTAFQTSTSQKFSRALRRAKSCLLLRTSPSRNSPLSPSSLLQQLNSLPPEHSNASKPPQVSFAPPQHPSTNPTSTSIGPILREGDPEQDEDENLATFVPAMHLPILLGAKHPLSLSTPFLSSLTRPSTTFHHPSSNPSSFSSLARPSTTKPSHHRTSPSPERLLDLRPLSSSSASANASSPFKISEGSFSLSQTASVLRPLANVDGDGLGEKARERWRPQTSPILSGRKRPSLTGSFGERGDIKACHSAPTLELKTKKRGSFSRLNALITSGESQSACPNFSTSEASRSAHVRGNWVASHSANEGLRDMRRQGGKTTKGGCIVGGKKNKERKATKHPCLCNGSHDPTRMAKLWSPVFRGSVPPDEDWAKLVFVYCGRRG